MLAVRCDDAKKKRVLAEGILKIHMHTVRYLPPLTGLCLELVREIDLDWLSAVR